MLDMFVGRQKKGPYNTHTLVSVLDKYFVMEEAGCCDSMSSQATPAVFYSCSVLSLSNLLFSAMQSELLTAFKSHT